MKIVLLVEGKTEKVFLPHLRRFLETRLANRMPRMSMQVYDGRIPTGQKLKRVVERLVSESTDAVVALTDVYTGKADFTNAADAKQKMRNWVGANPKFFAHAAQHDFEAWLLPFWDDIQRLSGSNRAAPPGQPEAVDHQSPPSYRIREAFRTGSTGRDYVKTRDAPRILEGKDLAVAATVCPELKALLNTILSLCDGAVIP